MLKKIYIIAATACREATLLIEKKQSGALSDFEKIQLAFHLSFCKGCNRYLKQSVLLDSILKKSAVNNITDFSQMRMADDAKARIKQAVADKLK